MVQKVLISILSDKSAEHVYYNEITLQSSIWILESYRSIGNCVLCSLILKVGPMCVAKWRWKALFCGNIIQGSIPCTLG